MNHKLRPFILGPIGNHMADVNTHRRLDGANPPIGQRVLLLFAIVIWLFGFGPSAHAEHMIESLYWVSDDRVEVLVSFPNQNRTYYFNNNAKRLCYSFTVFGFWRPTKTPALLMSEDGRREIGVLFHDAKEVGGNEDTSLAMRAAFFIIGIYERQIGTLFDKNEIVPFPSSKPGSVKWIGEWRQTLDGQEARIGATKYFVPVLDDWVAHITVLGSEQQEGHPTNDEFARQAIASLNTSSEPECYWPFLRQHIPSILGG